MDKTELLQAMRDGHAPIEAAGATMSSEALHAEAPGMPGWTRKDVLAHIEWWHRHSTAVVRGVRSGVDPYPRTEEPFDLNALNARILQENRERPDADVREGERASFQELLLAVEDATDRELFESGVVPWIESTLADEIGWDTFNHYREHVPHLVSE